MTSPAGGAAAPPAVALDDLTSSNVRGWLQSNHPKQLSLLDRFESELRLGRLSTSSTAASKGLSIEQVSIGSPPPSPSRRPSLNKGGASSGRFVSGSTDLRDRRLVTVRTLELLRHIVGSTRWRTGAQLMCMLRGLGRDLQSAGGYREPAIGNVVRRVMMAARDEVAAGEEPPEGGGRGGGREGTGGKGQKMGPIDELTDGVAQLGGLGGGQGMPSGGGKLSLTSMLWAHPQHMVAKRPDRARIRPFRADSLGSASGTAAGGGGGGGGPDDDAAFPPIFHASRPDLKEAVMEAIHEIMSDLEDLHKNINDQATSHIHNGEVVLTYALSKTIELFLKAAAAKGRRFQVVVCEGAPHYGGHAMARSLAEAGIDTVVVNDAATFGVMARVNKVLLPSHAVLANGGLIAPSGCHMVALAAHHNCVPVVAITGMFKLCPMYPHEGQDTLNDLVSPSSVVDYSEMGDGILSEIEFINPVHNYIPPQLVDLYVTNIGAFQPSYIYRLLAEYYHSDDWESFE